MIRTITNTRSNVFNFCKKLSAFLLLLFGIFISGECQENTKPVSIEEMIKLSLRDAPSKRNIWSNKLNTEFHNDWKSVLIKMWKDKDLDYYDKYQIINQSITTQSNSLNDILLNMIGFLDDDFSMIRLTAMRLITLREKNILIPTLREYISTEDIDVEIQKQISSELDDVLNYKFPSTVVTRTKSGSLCSYEPEYDELKSNFYDKWRGQWQKMVVNKWDNLSCDNKKRISGFFYSLLDDSNKLKDSSFNADMILRILYLFDDVQDISMCVYSLDNPEDRKAFIEGIYQLSKIPNKPSIKVNIESKKP